MDIRPAENIYVKAKKRSCNPEKWIRNVAKSQKAAGIPYIPQKSINLQPPKVRQDVSCRHGCRIKLSEEQKIWIFKRFYDLKDHEKQNIYMQGCHGGTGQTNWKLNASGELIYVCQKYFLGLHDVKFSRIRRKVLRPILPIAEGRGKHTNHKKTSDDILSIARNFLKNLPARSSHYSQANNHHRKYLDSNVTVASLYKTLIADENNMLTEANLKIWQFRKIFNFEFNIGIGYPRSDLCETCEVIKCSIDQAQATGNLEQVTRLKNTQERHWNDSNQFYRRMSKEHPDFNNPSHGFFVFDYEKNLQFPVTNISKEFFLRQLWLYNFTIHDLKTGQAHMFVYTENFAKKGSNETISFMKFFVENVISQEITRLHMYSDNSFGQNKNRFLIAYFHSRCFGRFDSVEINFPIPGHSRMQVDADFAIIEKMKRKQDKIHFPSEWVNIIRSARTEKPFIVYYGNNPVTDNLNGDGTQMVRVYDFKTSLEPLVRPANGINEIRRVLFRKERFHPMISRNMMDEPVEVFPLLKNGARANDLLQALRESPIAYDGFIPVTRAKYENIQYLLSKFTRPVEKTFYTSVVSLPEPENSNTTIINEVMALYPEPVDISFLL